MKRKNKLILEFTEFNLQRFNDTSVQASTHVDDPQLSINAFDKHQDALRSAMSRINDIMNRIADTGAYSNLRSKLAMEHQQIENLKILRITKSNNINYDVYITFTIKDNDYWGVVENLLGTEPKLKSEVFSDKNLHQAKEWIIKINGLIIKTLKDWLKPEPGKYKLLGVEVICNSTETGRQLVMSKGIVIDLVRAHSDRMLVRHENEDYILRGDNYVFFNWWFEKVD